MQNPTGLNSSMLRKFNCFPTTLKWKCQVANTNAELLLVVLTKRLQKPIQRERTAVFQLMSCILTSMHYDSKMMGFFVFLKSMFCFTYFT